ncbi:MAG: site-specific integrase [Candidatus Obscuribacterales bacterium]|nr:site-specific integrase [Candidatus Obscuribacterales bacterium]
MDGRAQGLLAYYLSKLPDERLSRATKKSYASVARQFVYFLEESRLLDELTTASFSSIAQAFLSSEFDGKGSSINARASAIKHFLRTLGMPCGTLERPLVRLTTRECLTDPELRSFFDCARNSDPRDRAISLIFATTGIQLKECAALNLDNIIYSKDVLSLEVVRNGRRRVVRLAVEAQSALEEYLDKTKPYRNYSHQYQALFVDRNGERMSMRALTAAVRKIGWAAKLSITPALLRVTTLTKAARQNCSAVTLAQFAGFESLESARRIIRASSRDMTRGPVREELTDLCFDVARNSGEIGFMKS